MLLFVLLYAVPIAMLTACAVANLTPFEDPASNLMTLYHPALDNVAFERR
jgi:hypothetical protein